MLYSQDAIQPRCCTVRMLYSQDATQPGCYTVKMLYSQDAVGNGKVGAALMVEKVWALGLRIAFHPFENQLCVVCVCVYECMLKLS